MARALVSLKTGILRPLNQKVPPLSYALPNLARVEYSKLSWGRKRMLRTGTTFISILGQCLAAGKFGNLLGEKRHHADLKVACLPCFALNAAL